MAPHRTPDNRAARRRSRGLIAWAFYDWANSSFATVIQTFVFAAYFTRRVVPDPAAGSSLWGLAIGGAGILVAVTAPVLGAIADRKGRRKPWLAGFTTLCVACWYGVFSLPLFLFSRDEPSQHKSLGQAAREGIDQIKDTLRNLRRYLTLLRFLIARMLYIDGLATIFAFGGVYAAGVFGMTESGILLFGITLNLSAGLGALIFSWVDDWIGSRQTILLSLVGLILPAAAILFAPSARVFWGLGILLGIFVGPVQAASRSYLAQAAPEALRNQMFGLYALSGKATAFVGPLAVAGITHVTGSQRAGMSVIVLLLAIGALLTWTLPRAENAARGSATSSMKSKEDAE